MAKLILRSVCVGIAAVLIAAFVGGFIVLSLLFMNSAPSNDQPTGYDSFFISVSHLPRIALAALAIFAIGFFLGLRYFSKRERRLAERL